MGILARLLELDRAAFAWINGAGWPTLDVPMRFISSDPFFWIVTLAVWIALVRGNPTFYIARAAAWLALGLLLADFISVHAFKDVFQRLRPCHDPACAETLRLVADACRGQYGFVSSHATNSAALVVLARVGSLPRWVALLLFLWVFLTGWSRVHLGVHFPGDVLGGWMVGALWAILWTRLNLLNR